MDVCEMIHVSPGEDGMGVERGCLRPAVATVEHTVRACAECAKATVNEGGILVAWDAPATPNPEPAPALGRCRELARNDLDHVWTPQEAVSFAERAVKEVLDRLESKLYPPEATQLRSALAEVRSWALGPSVPAQDQDR